jgi:hypothetical protein
MLVVRDLRIVEEVVCTDEDLGFQLDLHRVLLNGPLRHKVQRILRLGLLLIGVHLGIGALLLLLNIPWRGRLHRIFLLGLAELRDM